MEEKSSKPNRSAGGKARAKILTSEKRQEIAQRAASARWGVQKATHTGRLQIGDSEIECHVLEDGTRLLSRASFLRAIGRTGKAKGGREFDDEFGLPVFLTAKNLSPFITNELKENSEPIKFIPANGGSAALGYKAEMLPKICEVFLKARDSGDLAKMQEHIARQADVLIRGLANVGIVALVDEATGYQYDRARNALADILEAFIAEEVRKWTKTFPIAFYEQIFRLKGWSFDPESVKRPILIAKYTNDFVYDRLAPGVLEELKQKNPVLPSGRRKHKLFQWLSGDIGHPRLLAHLEGVTLLMKVSENWEQFKDLINKHYPKIATTELGFDVVLKTK